MREEEAMSEVKFEFLREGVGIVGKDILGIWREVLETMNDLKRKIDKKKECVED
jgi:hypothetical protein